jgi:hypothetical protein
MNEMDFTDDVDLIDNRSEYHGTHFNHDEPTVNVRESTDRMLNGENHTKTFIMDKLVEENKIKEQALEKASSLI